MVGARFLDASHPDHICVGWSIYRKTHGLRACSISGCPAGAITLERDREFGHRLQHLRESSVIRLPWKVPLGALSRPDRTLGPTDGPQAVLRSLGPCACCRTCPNRRCGLSSRSPGDGTGVAGQPGPADRPARGRGMLTPPESAVSEHNAVMAQGSPHPWRRRRRHGQRDPRPPARHCAASLRPERHATRSSGPRSTGRRALGPGCGLRTGLGVAAAPAPARMSLSSSTRRSSASSTVDVGRPSGRRLPRMCLGSVRSKKRGSSWGCRGPGPLGLAGGRGGWR